MLFSAERYTYMRVAIVNQYAVTPDTGGGTRHFDFARLLAKRGHRVRVYASGFNHFKKSYRRGVSFAGSRKELYEDSVEWIWVWSTPYKSNYGVSRLLSSLFFGLALLARGLVDPYSPEVIVGSSPDLFVAFFAYLWARCRRSAFVFEVRDLWPETLVAMGSGPRLLHLVMGHLARILYMRSDAVVGVTKHIAETIQSMRVSRVYYIPNGVDLGARREPSEASQKVRELQQQGWFVCVYAGNHAQSYGLDALLRAAKQVEEHKIMLVLLGDGPEKPRLKTTAQSLGINNVLFLGPVPKSQIMDVLESADALIESQANVDLFKGAAPNKLFDYLAAGRPIICANAGEGRRIVEEAGAGIPVEPESDSAIAAAMLRLRHDAALRDRFNGLPYVKARFSRDVLVKQLEAALESATRKNRRH